MYQYPLIYVYFRNNNYRNCFANYGSNRFHGTLQDGYGSEAFKQFGHVGQLSLTNVYALCSKGAKRYKSFMILVLST